MVKSSLVFMEERSKLVAECPEFRSGFFLIKGPFPVGPQTSRLLAKIFMSLVACLVVDQFFP